MRTFDLTPLLRSSIGFDDLFRFGDALERFDAGENSYPPYNIEKLAEDDYRISMAVAGFSPDELDVTVRDNELTISGQSSVEEDEREYLHHGIAKRSFERTFQLADTIKVTGASYDNGLLTIELAREIPEHKRPRTIDIATGKSSVRKKLSKAA